MTKKQILTDREIEKDIAASIKYPADMTENSYTSWTPIAIVIAGLALVVMIIKPLLLMWMLLGTLFFAIVLGIVRHFSLKYRAGQVSLDNYEITVEILHSKDYEHYHIKSHGRCGRGKTVDNYTWRFENGQSWRMPTRIYLWNERYSMARARVHEMLHRGDPVLVVTRKESNEVVAAYPTEIFEYRK